MGPSPLLLLNADRSPKSLTHLGSLPFLLTLGSPEQKLSTVRPREAADVLPETPVLHHRFRRRRCRAAHGHAEEAHDVLGGPAVSAGANRHRLRRHHPAGAKHEHWPVNGA